MVKLNFFTTTVLQGVIIFLDDFQTKDNLNVITVINGFNI